MLNGFKSLVFLTATTASITSLVGCGLQTGAVLPAGTQQADFGAMAKPSEIIVKFRSAQNRQALLQKMGLRTINRVERVDALVVTSADTKKTLAELQANPEVQYAEPNYIAKAIGLESATPKLGFNIKSADELLGQLWGMTKIEAEAAWKVTTGEKVKLAVVDTGIDYKHPDFASRVVDKGRDFSGSNKPDAMDDHYHGTHCAGTIGAGLGNGGVVGVAPNVDLVAVKVLSASGSGSYDGVANGIIYAADSGASIISMSLGGPSSSQVIDDAVKYAIGKGALVVAAMGNDNTERPSYPAAAPGVMAVGATTSGDVRSSFSNYGKHISVSAPGSDILSTVPGGKYKVLSGTSMACPHTAGLAALVKGAHPNYTAAQIRSAIEKGADDLGDAGFDKYFGNGRINAKKAVSL